MPSSPRRTPVVLAIDGGNIKTDVALVDGHGRLLAFVRSAGASPHALGMDGCVALLGELVDDASAVAGLPAPVADVARVLLAGADLPEEVAALQGALDDMRWAPRLVVENDTLALLRTGTDRGWGVAVVCGGGINAVGIAPDGRDVRFPALGAITGDWGGGYDVGVAALGAASRSADGRGPHSALEHAVPAYYGCKTPLDVARALHFEEMALETLAELAQVVYAHAAGDGAAGAIVAHLADEVAALAVAALQRLELCDAGPEVVLGGGLIRAAPRSMISQIEQRVVAVAPTATVVITHDGPIVGAALLGLDTIGAGPDAIARARAELRQAIAEQGSQPAAAAIPRSTPAVRGGGASTAAEPRRTYRSQAPRTSWH